MVGGVGGGAADALLLQSPDEGGLGVAGGGLGEVLLLLGAPQLQGAPPPSGRAGGDWGASSSSSRPSSYTAVKPENFSSDRLARKE